ncbi:hypothetical protein F5X98DRAFT_381449 [Xylaria grammica]|nr:hypothetical protein F5X98DRAFT_381449 [Xylaria grammica]
MPRVTGRRGDYGGDALPAPELLTWMSPASPQFVSAAAAATADGRSTRTYTHDPRDEIIYPLERPPHARKQGNRQLQAVDYRLLNVVPHLDELLLSVPTDFAATLEQATTTGPAAAGHEAKSASGVHHYPHLDDTMDTETSRVGVGIGWVRQTGSEQSALCTGAAATDVVLREAGKIHERVVSRQSGVRLCKAPTTVESRTGARLVCYRRH